MISRYNQRLSIIIFFYYHFVMKCSLSETRQFWENKKKFDDWQKPIFKYIFLNYEKIIKNIDKNLNENWKFTEISNFEKSILLVAISECFSKSNPIEISISEAVKLTKKFSLENNYQYINKVLHQILKLSL